MVTGALLVRCPVAVPSPVPSRVQLQILRYTSGAVHADSFQVDEEERPMNYTQVFQLLPDGAGSYFVFNDMFKLIYG